MTRIITRVTCASCEGCIGGPAGVRGRLVTSSIAFLVASLLYCFCCAGVGSGQLTGMPGVIDAAPE